MKNNIAEYLAYRGMTQTELGKKVGVAQTHISAYVNGVRNPKYDKALKIANALQAKLHDVFPDYEAIVESAKNTLTKEEATAIARFIGTNLVNTIRSADACDMSFICDLIHGYEKLCEFSGYASTTNALERSNEE